MDLGNFDANNIQPVSFDLIPDGWYEAMITHTEEKETQAKDKALNITFTILQEPYKDRLVWEFLNINHSTSEKAKNIARGKLSAICRAVGVYVPKDSTQLHNIPFMLKVGHEKRNDTGEDKNVPKDFKPKGGPQLSQVPPQGNAGAGAKDISASASAVGAGAAPWNKR